MVYIRVIQGFWKRHGNYCIMIFLRGFYRVYMGVWGSGFGVQGLQDSGFGIYGQRFGV